MGKMKKKLISFIVTIIFTLNSTGLPTVALAKPDALRPMAAQHSPWIERGIFTSEQHTQLKTRMRAFLDREDSVYEYEKDILLNYWKFLRGIIQGKIMPPFSAEIEPTDRCNLRCKRCFFRDVLGGGNSLDRETLLRAVDQLYEYGIVKLWFSGFGEPLVNPHTVEAMQRAIGYGMKVGLYTNGVLFDERVQRVALGASFIKVAIDAINEETFAALKEREGQLLTEMIIPNLKAFVALRRSTGSSVMINASFMIQPENYREMEEFVVAMKEIGVDSVQFKFPIGDGQELDKAQLGEAFESYERIKATYESEDFKIAIVETEEQLEGQTHVRGIAFQEYATVWVRPDGLLYPQAYSSFDRSKAFGDIRTESLKGIWEGEARRRILANIDPQEVDYVRYDLYLDPFLNWLQDEYKRYGERFLDWVETNYVLPLRASSQSPILIVGASGSVGGGLFTRMADSSVNVYGTWHSNRPVNSIEERWSQLDVTDRQAVFRLFEELKPKTVIHCVALLTGESEYNQELATKINVGGTKNIAEACKRYGAKLVFISTNHVFAGRKKAPYTERDKPHPVNHYGRTKLEAEMAVRNIMGEDGNWMITRIPYVVGDDQKYPLYLLGVLISGESVKVPHDTTTAPTHIDGLTEVFLRLIGEDRRGLYHIASSEPMSRYEATRRQAEAAGLDITLIEPVTFKEMVAETGVKRPQYSALTSVHGELTSSPRLDLPVIGAIDSAKAPSAGDADTPPELAASINDRDWHKPADMMADKSFADLFASGIYTGRQITQVKKILMRFPEYGITETSICSEVLRDPSIPPYIKWSLHQHLIDRHIANHYKDRQLKAGAGRKYGNGSAEEDQIKKIIEFFIHGLQYERPVDILQDLLSRKSRRSVNVLKIEEGQAIFQAHASPSFGINLSSAYVDNDRYHGSGAIVHELMVLAGFADDSFNEEVEKAYEAWRENKEDLSRILILKRQISKQIRKVKADSSFPDTTKLQDSPVTSQAESPDKLIQSSSLDIFLAVPLSPDDIPIVTAYYAGGNQDQQEMARWHLRELLMRFSYHADDVLLELHKYRVDLSKDAELKRAMERSLARTIVPKHRNYKEKELRRIIICASVFGRRAVYLDKKYSATTNAIERKRLREFADYAYKASYPLYRRYLIELGVYHKKDFNRESLEPALIRRFGENFQVRYPEFEGDVGEWLWEFKKLILPFWDICRIDSTGDLLEMAKNIIEDKDRFRAIGIKPDLIDSICAELFVVNKARSFTSQQCNDFKMRFLDDAEQVLAAQGGYPLSNEELGDRARAEGKFVDFIRIMKEDEEALNQFLPVLGRLAHQLLLISVRERDWASLAKAHSAGKADTPPDEVVRALVPYAHTDLTPVESKATLEEMLRRMTSRNSVEYHILLYLRNIVTVLAEANPIEAEAHFIRLMSEASGQDGMSYHTNVSWALAALAPVVSKTTAEKILPAILSNMVDTGYRMELRTPLASTITPLAMTAPEVAESEFIRLSDLLLIEKEKTRQIPIATALRSLAPAVGYQAVSGFFRRFIVSIKDLPSGDFKWTLLRIIEQFLEDFSKEAEEEFKSIVDDPERKHDSDRLIEVLAPSIKDKHTAKQYLGKLINISESQPSRPLAGAIAVLSEVVPEESHKKVTEYRKKFLEQADWHRRLFYAQMIKILAPALTAEQALLEYPSLILLIMQREEPPTEGDEEYARGAYTCIFQTLWILAHTAPYIAERELQTVIANLMIERDPIHSANIFRTARELALIAPAKAEELFESLLVPMLDKASRGWRASRIKALNALSIAIDPNMAQELLPRLIPRLRSGVENSRIFREAAKALKDSGQTPLIRGYMAEQIGFRLTWGAQEQLVKLIGDLSVHAVLRGLQELDGVTVEDRENSRIGKITVDKDKALRIWLYDPDKNKMLGHLLCNAIVEWKTGNFQYLYVHIKTDADVPRELFKQFYQMVSDKIKDAFRDPSMSGIEVKVRGPEWLSILYEIVKRKKALKALPAPDGADVERDDETTIRTVIREMSFNAVTQDSERRFTVPAPKILMGTGPKGTGPSTEIGQNRPVLLTIDCAA